MYEDSIKKSQRESRSEIIKGRDANYVISKLENTLNKKFIVKSGHNRIALSSVGVVNYDEIIKMTDEGGKSTYTFKVDRDDSSITKFYNLILQERADGNIIKLLEYTMTPEFAEQFKATFNYKNFQGTLQSFTVLNETPCPDTDILLVHVGQVLNDGNGATIGNNGNSGSNNSGNSTNSTNNSSNTNSGSTSNSSNSGTESSTTGTGYSSSNSGSTSGGGSQEYHDLLLQIECISNGYDWRYDEEEGEWGCYANPRHFKMVIKSQNSPTTSENNETSTPCSPNYSVVVLTPLTKCEQHFLQTTLYKNWLANHDKTPIYKQIMDYINGDGKGCSSEREQFINQCINQMQNSNIFTSLTPFIIEKQIDDSQLDSCSKQVYQQIKNTTQCDFANVLMKLGADTSIYNTTIKTEHNNYVDTYGNIQEVSSPANTVHNSPYNYTVYVNPDYSGKTKLFIAAIQLHELAHAYFFSLLDDYNTGATNSFYELPILYNAFETHSLNFNANLTHEEIANSYVYAISAALKEYQPGLPQQVYDDMAWGGLKDTPIFDTLFPIGNPNRERIINRYDCEAVGSPQGQGTPNEQNPVGQPCN